MGKSISTWSRPAGADAPPDLANFANLRALMGWGGLVVNDPAVDIVDLTRAFVEQARNESCGQCFPCRMGTSLLAGIMNRICAGQGREGDLEELARLARYVGESARCDIGRTSPKPILDALESFPEAFTAAVAAGEPRPRGSYVGKVTAPCVAACPAHVDIPGYVEAVRFDQPDRALAVVRQSCSLPGTVGRVCVHYCENDCRRGQNDAPVAIRSLKRYAADRELAAGQGPGAELKRTGVTPKKAKVAIVGAGPAGLSCAYYLGALGYNCTIFEALNEPGGMAAVGIPDYRLPRQVLRDEAGLIKKLGGEIRYGVKIGRDLSLEELEKRGYAAFFIAAGAPGSMNMGCQGEDQGYEGFMPGVDFLRAVADGKKPLGGERIAVVGGGNVAMDCVRSALRLGFKEVNLLYRRTVREMPADPVEIEESLEEGVRFHTLVAPEKIVAANGRVTGIECVRMELGEPDASGRRRPVPVAGSNFVLDCDAVVPAIGQACEVDTIVPAGVKTGRGNTIEVDPVTLQSDDAIIFGGGDCFTGPSTLIAALAAGQRAARYIDQYLETGACVPQAADVLNLAIDRLMQSPAEEQLPCPPEAAREHAPVADPGARIRDFSEVESVFSSYQARREARRCLRCYRLALAAIA